MEIKITVYGTPPTELIKDLQIQFITAQDAMEKMATDAKWTLDTTIRNSKKRAGSQGTLEKSIQVEKTPTGFGVGNLDYMQIVAPHWKIINHGGMVSSRAQNVPGFFGDVMPPNPAMAGTGVGRDSFTWANGRGNQFFFMHVKNPISPMNYIEKILMWAKTVECVHFSGWTKKTQSFSKVL